MTHLMRENAESIWRILGEDNGHFYICGDAKMAAEAISELLSGASPACLGTTGERLGLAKQEKEAWEKGIKP